MAGLYDQIIALYSRGLSPRDIQAQTQELYGVERSPELVSQISDQVQSGVQQWQNRPLGPLYPILYSDALPVKVRHEGNVMSQAVYLALGVNLKGDKGVLGRPRKERSFG